jgi:hypothetical protein
MTTRLKTQFLDYATIKHLDVPTGECKLNHVTVDCYKAQLWYVCPNPRDKRRVEAAEQLLAQGKYASKQRITLTDAQFANQANWRT